MADEEGAVRSTLLGVLSTLISSYPTHLMEPHLKLVTIYVCNGMTHLNKSIRAHSLEFLDLLTSHLPELMSQYTDQIIPNYIYLLVLASRSVNNTSQSSSAGSAPIASALANKTKGGDEGSDTKGKKTGTTNMRLRVITSFLKYLKGIFRLSGGSSHLQKAPKALQTSSGG